MKREAIFLPLVCAVAIALATWLAYAQVTEFEFVGWDDADYVTENRTVQRGLSAAGVRWAWTTGTAANWHPLTWISHMLDVELFGLDAGAHHRTSLHLHVLCALLLFGAIRSLCRSLGAAALTAALFALHPLHVESVAWIAERKDVLSTAFGFAALWAYAGYARRGGGWRYGLVFAGLAASLLSKATFVTLPFVLLLLDVWPLGRLRDVGLRRLALEKLPLFALAAAASTATYLVQRASGATSSMAAIVFDERLANGLVSYVVYLRNAFAPSGLAMFYPHPSLGHGEGWSALAVLGAALLLVALTSLALFFRRRRPYLLVGWLWYLGTLVPVLGLVQVGTQAMADRYTYVPLVGLFLALSYGLVEIARARPRWRVALVGAGLLVCLACLALTHRQVATWRNGETLARHALAVTDGNWIAHALLANVLRESGRAEEALEHYSAVIELGEATAPVLSNLGLLLLHQARTSEADESLRSALRLDAGYVPAHVNLGQLLSREERFDEALDQYRAALRLDPENLDAHNNLGVDLARRGRLDEALTHLQAVLRLHPTPAEAFDAHMNLGEFYLTRMEGALSRGDSGPAQVDRRLAAEHFRAARSLNAESDLPEQMLRQLDDGS